MEGRVAKHMPQAQSQKRSRKHKQLTY